MTSSKEDTVECLESNIVSENSGSDNFYRKNSGEKCESKHAKDAGCVQVRHRMHRSAVRPFFCCGGSEFSLVSLVDTMDLKDKENSHSIESHSVSDLEENSTDNLLPKVSNDVESVNTCNGCRRPTLSGRRKKGEKMQGKWKKRFWSLKFRGKLPHGSRMVSSHTLSESPQHQSGCICTSYRKKDTNNLSRSEDNLLQAGTAAAPPALAPAPTQAKGSLQRPPLIDLTGANNFDELYPIDDIDERRIAERAREINEGVEVGHSSLGQRWARVFGAVVSHCHLSRTVSDRSTLSGSASFPALSAYAASSDYEESQYGIEYPIGMIPQVHTQVDYVHCLVPYLRKITGCSFYWGVMDRYEAEKLLENKPEGTFLLRDSAQEDFLFSVSFRRYNRSLHARVEQWNHKFSFDAHDPAVYACDTVCGLIEHYKDPNCCMFFEPMLTRPLNRISAFSLQHLCRSEICSNITYDAINLLPLPKSLNEYLKYYHYKQKVRVRRLDIPA